MWKPTLVCVAAAAGMAFSAPALAKATWYVAQNAKTMNCIVTPTKPNGTRYTMVGTMTFANVSSATKDMRGEDACKVVTKASAKATPKPPATNGTPQTATTSQPPSNQPATGIGGVY